MDNVDGSEIAMAAQHENGDCTSDHVTTGIDDTNRDATTLEMEAKEGNNHSGTDTDDSNEAAEPLETEQEEEIKHDINVNVIVMSEAGKPIFYRHGSEEGVAKLCGFISAVRTSLIHDDRFGLGDIEYLSSGRTNIVFMTVGAITLIAVSNTNDGKRLETEAYLRLQLEYVYGQIILTLTEQVQNAFVESPNFDLRHMLGTHDSALLSSILDQAGPLGRPASFLTGGVETVFPINQDIRHETSQKLVALGNTIENTVFGILISNDKLLTLVQPNYRPHQLRTSDLQLILNIVKQQPGLLTSELWFPVCLPRFNSTGFLYVYTNCFDSDSKLCLVLLSQQNTTEQFEQFRNAATALRRELGLPAVVGSVLRILENKNGDIARSESEREVPFDDVAWKRSKEEAVNASDDEEEEYTMVFGRRDGKMLSTSSTRSEHKVDTVVTSVEACPLLNELQSASERESSEALNEYCKIAKAMHFVFRIDISVLSSNPQTSNGTGSLTQCISPPIGFPFCDEAAKRRVWSMYQKLNLRLRLGSASIESTMDAFDMITHDEVTGSKKEANLNGIGKFCPAIGLAESPPSWQGITYVLDDTELFVGMNGRGFELYITLPGTTPPRQAAVLGANLVRRLMVEDQSKLFLSTPLTWPK